MKKNNGGSEGNFCVDTKSQLKPEGYLVLVRESTEEEPIRQSKTIWNEHDAFKNLREEGGE